MARFDIGYVTPPHHTLTVFVDHSTGAEFKPSGFFVGHVKGIKFKPPVEWKNPELYCYGIQFALHELPWSKKLKFIPAKSYGDGANLVVGKDGKIAFVPPKDTNMDFVAMAVYTTGTPSVNMWGDIQTSFKYRGDSPDFTFPSVCTAAGLSFRIEIRGDGNKEYEQVWSFHSELVDG